MTTLPHPSTRTVAIVSQKGGAGKTTLAIHLAAAATRAGQISLVIDTDPQASASQWAEWRQGAPPEIIDSAPPRIASKIEAASEQGAQLIVIDTPPHADLAASKAVECAELVLIPCRPPASAALIRVARDMLPFACRANFDHEVASELEKCRTPLSAWRIVDLHRSARRKWCNTGNYDVDLRERLFAAQIAEVRD